MKLIMLALSFVGSLFAMEESSIVKTNAAMQRKMSHTKSTFGRKSFETPSPKLNRAIQDANKHEKQKQEVVLKQIALQRQASLEEASKSSSLKQLFCCCCSPQNPN